MEEERPRVRLSRRVTIPRRDSKIDGMSAGDASTVEQRPLRTSIWVSASWAVVSAVLLTGRNVTGCQWVSVTWCQRVLFAQRQQLHFSDDV